MTGYSIQSVTAPAIYAYDCMWIALDLLSLSALQLGGEKVDRIISGWKHLGPVLQTIKAPPSAFILSLIPRRRLTTSFELLLFLFCTIARTHTHY